MTNQTVVFSEADIVSNIAKVTRRVNDFVAQGIIAGYSGFDIKRVVVSPASHADEFWFTVQVNYYDPSVA